MYTIAQYDQALAASQNDVAIAKREFEALLELLPEHEAVTQWGAALTTLGTVRLASMVMALLLETRASKAAK